jgi:uncharacterized protein (TIGR02001 family)
MEHTLFQWREARAPVLTLLGILCGVLVLTHSAQAADLSGSATLTSDYIWRGSSQTQDGPAVQAGITLRGNSGFYASVWGSNVKPAPEAQANTEFDITVGWGKQLRDNWAVDVNLLRYQYPSTATDLNWTELNSTLTYKQTYWASVGHSNQALGAPAAGTYLAVGAKYPLTETVRIEASAARYVLRRSTFGRDGYSHAQLNAVWAIKAPFEVRLGLHRSDRNARHIFGRDATGTRLEAAMQANF